jgi:hypothetical protein
MLNTDYPMDIPGARFLIIGTRTKLNNAKFTVASMYNALVQPNILVDNNKKI